MGENKMTESDIEKTLGLDKPSGRRNRLRRWVILGLLLAGAGAGVFYWLSRDTSSEVRFKTQPATRGDITVTVSATGNLAPINQVDVGSELSGIVKSVEADYNDRVVKGQVLARLDRTKLEAEVKKWKAALESARANVLSAQATLKETELNLRRMKSVREISGGKVPSQQEMDATEAALARAQANTAEAKAQVSQSQANLESYETDLAKTNILSPVDGVVLTRSVEQGQTVAASLQAPVLFTLAEDLTKMELNVDVDEADVGQLVEGQKAVFTVDAYPEKTFAATVTQVRYGATTTAGVVTYETVLEVDNSNLLLRPGMTATADITVQEVKDVLLVPNAALRFTPPAALRAGGKDQGGGLLSKLMPRPPRRPDQSSASGKEAGRGRQRVWVSRDGGIRSIPIVIGVTDGKMTVVKSGDIEPGTELATDTIAAGK